MSDLNQISFDDRRKPAPAPHGAGRFAPAALALASLALAGVVWLAFDAQTRDESLRRIAGNAELQAAQTGVVLKQVQAQFTETQNRVAQLEGKLAEMQTQRIAMEEMYRELARAPDDWLLAEIEQTLNIAAQQLQLAGNVRAAIMALQTADARLARADKLQVVQLRRALNQDLDKLKALPFVDVPGISIKLDNVINLVDSLPLIIAESSALNAPPPPQRVSDESGFRRVARDFWEDMKQLVRIRQVEGSDMALLAPQQSYFLRENLKLRLLAARSALLARDDVSYKEDLKHARQWINRYYDPKAKVNSTVAATLKQLYDSAMTINAPDINTSINAVRAARAAREKSTVR